MAVSPAGRAGSTVPLPGLPRRPNNTRTVRCLASSWIAGGFGCLALWEPGDRGKIRVSGRLRNHIGVLRQFLVHEKYQEAVHYLDELQAPVRDLTATVWTGDETADYLINSKAASAESSGIRFQVQVEYPRRTNIRSVDLCAILGNLLDNALEAARQVQEPSGRMVSLIIRRIHQMLVIKVENSFAVAPVQENGELKTTKAEDGLHGWGLKSAQTAAEKYDGMVQAGVSGDVFREVAALSYQRIEDFA